MLLISSQDVFDWTPIRLHVCHSVAPSHSFHLEMSPERKISFATEEKASTDKFPTLTPTPLSCTKTIRELPSKMGMSHVVILVADQTRIYPLSKRLSSVIKEQKRKTSHWRTSIRQFLSRKRPSCCSQCAQAHCTLCARTHARHLFLPLFFLFSLLLAVIETKKKYTR